MQLNYIGKSLYSGYKSISGKYIDYLVEKIDNPRTSKPQGRNYLLYLTQLYPIWIFLQDLCIQLSYILQEWDL